MVEVYNWEKLAELATIPEEPVVNVTRDIVDYFTDIAKATDDREMGGFLLGQAMRIGETPVIQFYDYIQTPNEASDPTTGHRPPIESFREVYKMVKEGRYNVLARMHTHPSDTWFSIEDLRAVFYRVKDFYICGLRFPEEIEFFLKCAPDFLVTGGEIGYVMSYTDMPYVLRFQSDEKGLIAEVQMRELIAEPQYLVDFPRKAREKFPNELDEFYSFVEHLCFTATRVDELEGIPDVIGMLEEDFSKYIIEGKFDVAGLLDKLVSMLQRTYRGEPMSSEVAEVLKTLEEAGYNKEKIEMIRGWFKI